MNFKRKFTIAAQTLMAMSLVAILMVACGGGETGFTQTYISSAGAGEVMQFSVDTTAMTYSYKVIESSYGYAGQTGSGFLLGKTAIGRYVVGQSADSFILGGDVLPLQNGFLVGHVQLILTGLTVQTIPVFGVPDPITSLATLADTYNYQGFGCLAKSVGNVFGNAGCHSESGTIKVDASGNYTVCDGVNITATSSCSTSTGTIVATSTAGVFDYRKTSTGHIGWFFAYTAANGQKVAVIDHDDTFTPEYGHAVATTQAVITGAAADGNYFTANNEGIVGLLTVSGSGTAIANTLLGTSGSLAINSPWNGLATYQLGAVSGVAMVAGAGAYTYTVATDSAAFGVGLKY